MHNSKRAFQLLQHNGIMVKIYNYYSTVAFEVVEHVHYSNCLHSFFGTVASHHFQCMCCLYTK